MKKEHFWNQYLHYLGVATTVSNRISLNVKEDHIETSADKIKTFFDHRAHRWGMFQFIGCEKPKRRRSGEEGDRYGSEIGVRDQWTLFLWQNFFSVGCWERAIELRWVIVPSIWSHGIGIIFIGGASNQLGAQFWRCLAKGNCKDQ